MIHLANDYHVDADNYCFIIKQKGVYESGKQKGQEKIENILYPAHISGVERFIADEGVKQYINGDWNRMVSFIETSLKNFQEGLPALIKKRYK